MNRATSIGSIPIPWLPNKAYRLGMSQSKSWPASVQDAPLTVEQLETGLLSMSDRDTDLTAFWSEHVEAFRRTIFVAIRDTSDALRSPEIPQCWRLQLERQLEELVGYLDLMDGHNSTRSLRPEAPCLAFPAESRRVH